jgi:3-hydroxyacyl-[acyl-carrier-protein] dehydratase
MSELAELIPHRPPMVLIDALGECTAQAAEAVKTFLPDSCGVREGYVQQGALIEALAQTAAALFGRQARAQGRGVGVGMLVGVSAFRFHAPVRCGEPLKLSVTVTRHLPPLCLAEGRVWKGGLLVAEGSLKFYISGEEPAA